MRVGVLVLMLLSIVACKKGDGEGVDVIIAKSQLQTETGNNVEILYSDSARVKVKINAPLLLRNTDRNSPEQEFPKGIMATFFDANQQIQSRLKGKYAIRYEQEGRTVIRDSIEWLSVQLERLETSELIWDEKQNIVYSDKFVKITKPGEVIYGWGFRTNSDFTNWRINAIEGRFKADGLTQQLE